jgi:ubiquinone/menaquinone biosynthesis C-methylase UbiE
VDALRHTWSAYPRDWRKRDDLNMGYQTLGEEWGGPDFADAIVEELARPYLGPDKDVLELGCGGGKFSQRLAPLCRSLVCTDISQAMLDHARAELSERGVGGEVSYEVLNGQDFAGIPDHSVDFVFSYDVQLHLQPQNVFSYLLDAKRVLRPAGAFMLHQVDLASKGGSHQFLLQYYSHTWQLRFDHPKRRGHIYFMSEDQMRALADAAEMDVDRMVVAWPPEGHRLHDVTGGRDLIGFLSPRAGSVS